MSLFSSSDYRSATPFFRFETDGDTVEGVVKDYKQDVTSNYGPQDVVTIETDKGAVKVGASSILRDKIRNEHPEPGMLLGIRYLGKVTSPKSGREYRNFAVVSKRQSVFEAPAKDVEPSPW